MERYSERAAPRIEYAAEHYFARRFNVDPTQFIRNTNIPIPQLQVLQYSFSTDQLSANAASTGRNTEVLFNSDSSTLIVPPPHTGKLEIEDLAGMALPVVGYIRKTKPDIVIGCDRGARFYSLAVRHAWDARHPGKRFPSLDKQLHFARLSTSLDLETVSKALERIIIRSYTAGQTRGRGIHGDEPHIMFIDDWIVSGATRHHIEKALQQLGIRDQMKISFALMCGSGGNVSGTARQERVPWQDDEDVIGVGYNKRGRPYPVRTNSAQQIRLRLHEAIKGLGTTLRR